MHMSDHIKDQIKGKVQERDGLEATILQCTTRLEASGAGLHNKLVDEEVNNPSQYTSSPLHAVHGTQPQAVMTAGVSSCRY